MRKQPRLSTMVSILLVMGGLAWFIAHLWTFDYQYRDKEFGGIQPDLRVAPSEEPGRQGLVASLIFTNISSRRIRLLDTRAPAPLYELELLQLATGQTHRLPRKNLSPASLAYDRKRDAWVELLPGAVFTRQFDLAELFSLTAGRYRLTVKYRPDLPEYLELPIYAEPLACIVPFEVKEPKELSGADQPR